jgi:hypothetical protein
MVRNHNGDDEEEVRTETLQLPEYKDQVRSYTNSSNSNGPRNLDPPAMRSTEFLSNNKPSAAAERQAPPPSATTTPQQDTTVLPMARAIPLARYMGSAPISSDGDSNNNHNHNDVDTSVVSPIVVTQPFVTTTATKRSSTNSSNVNTGKNDNNDNNVFVLKVSRTTCMWSMAVLLLLGAVIGGFCGAGKCSSSSSSNNTSDKSINSGNNNNNSTVPSAVPPPSTSNNNNPSVMISATESYLRNISLLSDDSEQIFIDAENLAILWLERNDNTTILDVTDPMVQLRLQQKFVLANMYYASTNPDAWMNKTNWFTHPDECQWYGMTCTPLTLGELTTGTTTTTTNNNNQVG